MGGEKAILGGAQVLKKKEGLTGFCTLSRTVNLGGFNSIKIEVSEEFLLSDSDHALILDRLNEAIKAWIETRKIVAKFD